MSTAPFDVVAIDDRQAWDGFLGRVDPHTFLQAWAWGEFNRCEGNAVWRWHVVTPQSGTPVAALQAIGIRARRGAFIFCPHGPVLPDPTDHAALAAAVDCLVEQGRTSNADFVRVSSLQPDTAAERDFFRRRGFLPAPIHMHPERAWLLDVTPDVGTLLSGMRKTMRQLIRKSQQLGITVRHGVAASDAATFLDLYRRTAKRQHFVAFSDRYVRDELFAFGADAQIFLAEHEGKVLAGAVIVFSGRSAFYHHGASVPPSNNLPAAYLLQWEAIREAKRRGCQWYNFWGIAPPHQSNHPWAGLTAFKQGFGGQSEAYLHTQDYPRAPRYWLTYAIERFRRVRRGL